MRAQHATALTHAAQARPAVQQAIADTAHATATIQEFTRQLAAAEARQAVAQF